MYIWRVFKCKNRYINFLFDFWYLRLKLLKNKENNKKICNICSFTNFKNSPCYVMSEVTLKRFNVALFDDGLTLQSLKFALICFCIHSSYNIPTSIMVLISVSISISIREWWANWQTKRIKDNLVKRTAPHVVVVGGGWAWVTPRIELEPLFLIVGSEGGHRTTCPKIALNWRSFWRWKTSVGSPPPHLPFQGPGAAPCHLTTPNTTPWHRFCFQTSLDSRPFSSRYVIFCDTPLFAIAWEIAIPQGLRSPGITPSLGL